jgi:hypothetical protein
MKECILIIDTQGQAGYHFKWFKGVESDESSITEHNCVFKTVLSDKYISQRND